MKQIYNYIGSLLMLLVAFTACSPEDIAHPSESGVPLAENIDVEILVDQEINLVTFNMKNKGCMPVWIIDGKEYSTVNGFSKIYSAAGTYTVDVRIANANGISDGVVTKSFTVNNTIVNFDMYLKFLTGNETKEWVIARKEPGHMGCGPSGTDGYEYFSAQPNEKAAFGMYDNVLTFGKDYEYKYNPGASGTVYVNVGCSIFSDYNTTGEDFTAPVEEQTTTYKFDVVGNDVYITFPAKTLFPYMANDDAYNTPRYRIENISNTKLELITDNGEIAWHYILESGEETKPGGYDPNSDCNMWKDAQFTNTFYYAPGWAAIADPEFTANGNSYKIDLPIETFERWQAQVAFVTDMTTNAVTNYDFSAIFNATKDHNNVTVKLVKDGDDGVFYFEESIALKAYENYAFIKTDMEGIDMDNVKLVLDFGGNKAETVVTVSRIVLKENSCDDGTVIEVPGEEEDSVNWQPDSDCNMWKSANYTNSFFYADADWNQIADPGFTANGNSYKVVLPAATVLQWQAQVAFKTDMATNGANAYDFRCILNSTKDIKGVTIKLVKEGDDDTFYFASRVDLNAYEEHTFKMVNMEGIDMDNVNLVFDFGGNPENTEVTISSIILKEHDCDGTPTAEWKPESACNLWKTVNYTNFFYYAPDWQQIADPAVTANGNSYKIALPVATFVQWQAQVHFLTDIATDSTNPYDFHCIFNSTININGVTVKLTDSEDDNVFFFTERIDLNAYEAYTFEMVNMEGIDMDKVKLVFDFGGNPENAEVTVSSIILKESGCNN